MSEEPLVSVVTPSYNQGQFIEETLDSVASQTYSTVEHIVIDGESTDGTVEILEERDEEVTWISEPDEGQSQAINKGFERASGEIVGWLNSDDVFFDTRVLERVVQYFEQSDADIVYGDMALLSEGSDVLKIQTVPDFDIQKLLRYCYIEQPALFFRGSVIEDQHLKEHLEYVMDYEFWLRLSRTYRFKHVDDVLAGDRNHSERKILADRQQLQAATRALQAKYGVRHDVRFTIDRVLDRIFSGLPRRGTATIRTVGLHANTPELAFDGELRPLPEMLQNVFRPNHKLL